MHKLPVDLKGSAYLVFFSFLMASNQIAIKLGNQGFDPVSWRVPDQFWAF